MPNEELTALGYHLATLPVDVRIGKLILLGAVLGCTERALTLAAALSCRSAFVAPMGMRAAADDAKVCSKCLYGAWLLSACMATVRKVHGYCEGTTRYYTYSLMHLLTMHLLILTMYQGELRAGWLRSPGASACLRAMGRPARRACAPRVLPDQLPLGAHAQQHRSHQGKMAG